MSADYGSRGISRRGILKGATALGAAAMIAPLGATRARAMASDATRGTLVVHLRSAANLRSADRGGSSDPYVTRLRGSAVGGARLDRSERLPRHGDHRRGGAERRDAAASWRLRRLQRARSRRPPRGPRRDWRRLLRELRGAPDDFGAADGDDSTRRLQQVQRAEGRGGAVCAEGGGAEGGREAAEGGGDPSKLLEGGRS